MKKGKIVIMVVCSVIGIALIISVLPKKVGLSYDYPTASNYSELIENSSYVVKGYFLEFDHEWNMSRNMNNEPSEIFETIGRVYTFQVNESYKGHLLNNNILINQQYSETLYYEDIGKDTSQITSQHPKMIVYNELYIEPNTDKEYILFLDYDKENDLYYPSIEPFMVIKDQNHLIVQTHLSENNMKTVQKARQGIKTIEVEIEHVALCFEDSLNYDEFLRLCQSS